MAIQNRNNNDDFDVIVVGGGPGGSTASTLIALEGHRVLLLEKEQFPRYQIGESLIPATVHGICAMLGVRETVGDAGFSRKSGGTFKWGTNPEPWSFLFAASSRMSGPTSYAYQVERSRFDEILLDNAAKRGVDVRQRHQVTSTRSAADGRITGVCYTDEQGREHEARARFVVDASGQGSRIHKDAGGRREFSSFFRNLALFGYFTGGRRMPEPNSGNILCVAFSKGWFWYIPLSATLTSVGAVVTSEFAPTIDGDPQSAFSALIDECPMIRDYLADARRADTAPYDQVRARRDWSYDNPCLWTPGMVLVGDAACFIDPVFSSGVHLATYSGMLAARSINTVLSRALDEKRCFEEFEARYRREFGVFHDFLVAFYDIHTDEDSYFWRARKSTGGLGTREEAFASLVGGVTSSDFARRSPTSSTLRPGDGTGFGTSGEVPSPLTDRLPEVRTEGRYLQMRGALGETAGQEPPMFAGGLVPTPDGRRWTETS